MAVTFDIEALNEASDTLEDIQRDIDDLRDSANDVGDETSDSMDDASDSMDRAGGSAETLGDKMRRVGKGVANVGAEMAAAGAAVAVGSGVKSVQAAGRFEDAIASAAAKTSNAQLSMEKFNAAAKQAGQVSTKSATDAAGSLQFLAQAGLSAQQSVEALPGVLELSAAGSLDLAQASDIATNVLSGMRLEVADLARVNDVLVAASSAANTGVGELGQAFSFVAPKARAVGMSVEQTASILGTLANAGIKSTRAGRGLRSALAALQNPTDKLQAVLDKTGISLRKADGDMRAFSSIIQDFSDAGALKQLSGSMSSVAGSVVEVVGPAISEVGELRKGFQEAGGEAQKQAELMRSSMGAQLEILKGSFETLMVTMGERFKPVVMSVSSELTNLSNESAKAADAQKGVSKEMRETAQVSGELTAVLGELLPLLGAAATDVAGGWAFTGKLASTGTKAIGTMVGLRDSSEEASRGLRRYKEATEGAAGVGEMLSAVSAGQNGQLDLLGSTTDEVYEANKRLAEATRQYGLESDEAKEAAKELQEAMGQQAGGAATASTAFETLGQKARDAAVSMFGAKTLTKANVKWELLKGHVNNAKDALQTYMEKQVAQQEKANDRLNLEKDITKEKQKQADLSGFVGDFKTTGGITEGEAKRRGASGFGLANSGGGETASLSEIAGPAGRTDGEEAARRSRFARARRAAEQAKAGKQAKLQKELTEDVAQQQSAVKQEIQNTTTAASGLVSTLAQLPAEGSAAAESMKRVASAIQGAQAVAQGINTALSAASGFGIAGGVLSALSAVAGVVAPLFGGDAEEAANAAGAKVDETITKASARNRRRSKQDLTEAFTAALEASQSGPAGGSTNVFSDNVFLQESDRVAAQINQATRRGSETRM